MLELSAEQRRALQALQRAYRSELVGRVADIVDAAESLRPGRRDRRGLREVRHLAHRLAGSAGICGFAALGRAAARIEEAALSTGADAVTVDFVAELRRLTRALRKASPPRRGLNPAAPAASGSRG
jgi:HPt (histidine-containing phosphotransfer) domain-containing protein